MAVNVIEVQDQMDGVDGFVWFFDQLVTPDGTTPSGYQLIDDEGHVYSPTAPGQVNDAQSVYFSYESSIQGNAQIWDTAVPTTGIDFGVNYITEQTGSTD